MERWDAYDSSFNLIKNMVIVRGEAITDGVFHLVSEVIVRHTDGTYLLMQRDQSKHLGGKWELTAGGAVLKGESALVGALRELKEETGIETSDLVELERIVHHENRSLYVLYLCVTDWKKDNITLQEGETMAFRWIGKDELLNMEEGMTASPRTMAYLRKE